MKKFLVAYKDIVYEVPNDVKRQLDTVVATIAPTSSPDTEILALLAQSEKILKVDMDLSTPVATHEGASNGYC